MTDKLIGMNMNRDFERYIDFTAKVSQYPAHGTRMMGELAYLGLGLAGEAGEAANVIKKVIRRHGVTLTEQERKNLISELGDILWYLARITWYLEVDIETVLQQNIKKLTKRMTEGKITNH